MSIQMPSIISGYFDDYEKKTSKEKHEHTKNLYIYAVFNDLWNFQNLN